MVRFAARVALASIVVGSLGGCALVPLLDRTDHETAAESPDGAPSVGDCWATNYDDLANWSNWEGDGPVDCDQKHQSYTYSAEQITAEIDSPYDRGGMSGELAYAASEQCNAALEKEFDWTPIERRLGIFFFVPTEAQWEAGRHEVRCDIAVTAVGSDFLNTEINLEALPTDIAEVKDDLANNPEQYQLCLTGDGYGPYEGSSAFVVNCDDYDWRWGGTVDYPGELDSEYPAEESLRNYAIDECPALGIADGETVYPYLPSPDWWVDGDHSIECWFSTVPGEKTIL